MSGVNEEYVTECNKELMDLEFPDPSISVSADVGGENWLICPDCLDAWECKNNIDALVKCPKCMKKLNNPRYTNRLDQLDWRGV